MGKVRKTHYMGGGKTTENSASYVPIKDILTEQNERIVEVLEKAEDLTQSRTQMEGKKWWTILHHCLDTLNEECLRLQGEIDEMDWKRKDL